MIRELTVLLAAVIVSAAAPSSGAPDDDAILDKIEQQVQLPERAGILSSYGRYYYQLPSQGSPEQVVGVYIKAGTFGIKQPRSGREWRAQDQIPRIADGGCSVVTVIYDVKASRIVSARCNGYA